jgi:hypothetical protein
VRLLLVSGLAASVVAAIVLVACAPKSTGSSGGGAADSSRGAAQRSDVDVTGTVRHFDLEGGFWAIRGDDSVTYDPRNSVPDSFRQEGLRVRLKARKLEGVMGTHQVGPIVEVLSLTKL